jgi:hypothetical protein
VDLSVRVQPGLQSKSQDSQGYAEKLKKKKCLQTFLKVIFVYVCLCLGVCIPRVCRHAQKPEEGAVVCCLM